MKLRRGRKIWFVEDDIICHGFVREHNRVGVYLQGRIESIGEHQVCVTYHHAINYRMETSKNPIYKVVWWLNHAISTDNQFVQNLKTVSLVTTDRYLIHDSPFQFSEVDGQGHLSMLGLLNGCFGDQMVIAVTDDQNTILEFRVGTLDATGKPVFEDE